jgi:hypothetical protein
MVVDASPVGFSPIESPRIAVTGDSAIAAIHEASRVTILELPSGEPFVEIGVDPEAVASDIAWVGSQRLLVLSRYAAHSTVHLIDPYGPVTLAEIRLESPMRLFAAVGASALVVGAVGAVVVTATETHLLPYPVPTRVVPLSAGAAPTQFLVAHAGSIEEWDAQSRTPRRRLRLPRAAAITAVGGSERLVWLTTQQAPARIDVIPLVNRGQPRAHDLPEPIERISSHPRSDLIACIGTDSGRVYVIDLDGRTPLRTIEPPGLERVESVGLILGRAAGVLAAQAGRPIAFVPFDGRAAEPDPPAAPPSPVDDDESEASVDLAEPADAARAAPPSVPPVDPVQRVRAASPQADRFAHIARAAISPIVQPPIARTFSAPSPPPARPAPVSALFRQAAAPATRPASSVSDRFSAWRDQVRQDQPRDDAAPITLQVPQVPPAPPAPPAPLEALSWRDEVVAWSRAWAAGAADPGAPTVDEIDAVITRFDLGAHLYPVLVLLYAAHLCGATGVAPVDVARVLGTWDEALGRGELAERGVAAYARSRVALSPPILRVLDELPPLTGTLIGEPGAVALLGPCVVVAGDEPLAAIAQRCLARVGGAILAAHDSPDRAALYLEARARGAAPMLRATASLDALPGEPAIFVVDEPLADRAGLPRLT